MRTISKLAIALSLGVMSLPVIPASAQEMSCDLIHQARTFCREDGRCFNTSGRPVYQPRVRRNWRDGDRGMRRHRDRDDYRRDRNGYDG